MKKPTETLFRVIMPDGCEFEEILTEQGALIACSDPAAAARMERRIPYLLNHVPPPADTLTQRRHDAYSRI